MRYLLELMGAAIVVYFLISGGPAAITYVEEHGVKSGITRLWEGPNKNE